MCGIAGIVSPNQSADYSANAARMGRAQSHRGPDAAGLESGPGYSFSHQRLAIIDLSGGAQPMRSADGNHVLVFNGEIYNYRFLRKELEARGRQFRTASDTEVLLQALEEWGASALVKVEGIFAFAFYTVSSRSLLLVRDRLGIKPLYFSISSDGVIAFGSELKALMSYSGIETGNVCPKATLDYFTLGYIPPWKSIYKNIEQVRPGHVVELSGADTSRRDVRYWKPEICEHREDGGISSPSEVWDRIVESVDHQLVADVPLSVFLSGGIDSSAVTLAMARQYENETTAYSVEIGSGNFNEIEFARMVAQSAGVTLKEQRATLENAMSPTEVVNTYDEPFADSSSIPTAILCSFAGRSHKVSLSGDGGDEIFAGYGWYQAHVMRENLRRRFGQGATRMLAGFGSKAAAFIKRSSGRSVAAGFFASLSTDAISGYVLSQSLTTEFNPTDVLSHDLAAKLQGYKTAELFRDIADESGLTNPLAVAQYLDMHMYLPGDILTKVDRASMRASLEVRVPLLDESLIKYANSLSRSTLTPNGIRKGLLTAAVSPRMPKAAVQRPKQGFSVPLDDWFDHELGDRLEAKLKGPDGQSANEYLNLEYCERLLKAHRGKRARLGQSLWAVHVFLCFLDTANRPI